MSPCIYVFISVSNCERVFSPVRRRGCMRPQKRTHVVHKVAAPVLQCSRCAAAAAAAAASHTEAAAEEEDFSAARLHLSPAPSCSTHQSQRRLKVCLTRAALRGETSRDSWRTRATACTTESRSSSSSGRVSGGSGVLAARCCERQHFHRTAVPQSLLLLTHPVHDQRVGEAWGVVWALINWSHPRPLSASPPSSTHPKVITPGLGEGFGQGDTPPGAGLLSGCEQKNEGLQRSAGSD